MTSLIILLWACGWVTGMAGIAIDQGSLRWLDVYLAFALSPIIGIVGVFVALPNQNHIAWRRK